MPSHTERATNRIMTTWERRWNREAQRQTLSALSSEIHRIYQENSEQIHNLEILASMAEELSRDENLEPWEKLSLRNQADKYRAAKAQLICEREQATADPYPHQPLYQSAVSRELIRVTLLMTSAVILASLLIWAIVAWY